MGREKKRNIGGDSLRTRRLPEGEREGERERKKGRRERKGKEGDEGRIRKERK